MAEHITEHEILSALFLQTQFSIVSLGVDNRGRIPIYKRTYGNCKLHYGTLVDVLNNPSKYEKRPDNEFNIYHMQEKITRQNEIEIKAFDWYEVSDAIELLSYNGHVKDESIKSPFPEDIANRVIILTHEGVIAYLSKHYLKEYKKSQLDKIDEERANLDLEKLRNEYFDYPETKWKAKWSFIISVGTLILSIVTGLLSIILRKSSD